jgi:predicted GH43/DUF377 family glycosyl hydrolase/cbb3-type cytochrome oxidase subunit 3
MTGTVEHSHDMEQLFLIATLILICFIGIVVWRVLRRSAKKKPATAPPFLLNRIACNPVIAPTEEGWQSHCTFNPGAVRDDNNLIHLFFRAIGGDGTSTIGYATSTDGNSFTIKAPYPIYREWSLPAIPAAQKKYDLGMYTSGGGWAGCEDPRTVIIDGRVYMTYVAFEHWNSIQMKVTSIALTDLQAGRWNWQKPITLSPVGEVHKNWMLFPEKVHGKFAILHAISPTVLIDYVEDFDTIKFSPINSRAPHDGHHNYFGRQTHWDSSVRSAGAPPIKTKYGWLLLYHAMDKNDPNKYKLGAMILDKDDPTIIRYRSPHAILSPEWYYENDAKPGVIYASGAVVHDGELLVYYGGGDKYVCMASTRLTKLLHWLVRYGRVETQ